VSERDATTQFFCYWGFMKINLDLKKLAQQVAAIDTISKKDGWSYHYDEELDSLYFSPRQVANKFTLYFVSDDFSVYVDNKSNLGGIFIEYYKSNLSSHEDKFRPFKTIFTKTMNKPEFKQKKILLSEVLKAEILAELVNKKETILAIPA